jgi:NAD+ synthase
MPMMNNTQKIQYIAQWIVDYVNEMPNSAETLVIGVSGGIDSALTSTLASITGINTIVVTMPIKTNPNQVDLGSIHSKWLINKYNNVSHHVIDLTKVYQSFYATLQGTHQESELGFANSKARLRMMTLYQVAASNHGLVIGTGNKVEDFGVGFYTKYGDGGVDISPIADLMKSDVKDLSITLGIDQRIINAEPTDGLWDDGRTDENQLGMSYQELEEAMTNIKSINRNEYEKIRLNNSHKMKPIPVCKLPKS